MTDDDREELHKMTDKLRLDAREAQSLDDVRTIPRNISYIIDTISGLMK